MEIEFIDDENQEQNQELEQAKIIYDGIGLSIEEVQALIAKANKSIIERDDPFLILVTILNAFLAENLKVQEKYQGTLKNIYSEQVNDFVSKLELNTNEIKALLQATSLESLNKIQNKQSNELRSFSSHLQYAGLVFMLCTLTNIAIFIWS